MSKGSGFKMDIKLNGADELVHKLNAIGRDAAAVLAEAARAGTLPMFQHAEQNAPGEGMTMEVTKAGHDQAIVLFGPDEEHFYYKFHETGVQPFEVNMVKRRTRRTAIDIKKSKAKGKLIKVRGRRVGGDTQALLFDGQYAKHMKRGGMAAQPFMRPAFDSKRADSLDAFGDHIREHVIDKHMERP
jgi:hypothetical protein